MQQRRRRGRESRVLEREKNEGRESERGRVLGQKSVFRVREVEHENEDSFGVVSEVAIVYFVFEGFFSLITCSNSNILTTWLGRINLSWKSAMIYAVKLTKLCSFWLGG